MSRSAEVTLDFAGEERVFRLPLGRLRALQEKTDCGPMELLQRFQLGTWRVDDIRETILQGLKGGGMADAEAAKLLKTDFDDLPLLPFVTLAQGIVMAAVIGPADEVDDAGEDQGEGTTNLSPDQNSGSPVSTEPPPQ